MNNVEIARPAQKPNVIKKSQVGGSQLNQLIKITGILTSHLETRQKYNQSYYYGFFKLENQAGEFPVVFKTKPEIPKGSEVELTGNDTPGEVATEKTEKE
ncbi:10653_t:CDS:2 [Entrophospora sp. SA101]|nr:10653_t:CDS:2 [Entrophospora sp. SA101]